MKYAFYFILAACSRPAVIPSSLPVTECKAVTTCDGPDRPFIDAVLAGLKSMPVPQKLVESQDVAGTDGAPGQQGIPGRPGPTGAPGQNFGNTIMLSAARTYEPLTDYQGVVTVTAILFLPTSLRVIEGDQERGHAYLDFGHIRCSYRGDDRRGGTYVFVSCKNQQGQVQVAIQPGKPFAYAGQLILSLGDGADLHQTTQILAFLQFQ